MLQSSRQQLVDALERFMTNVTSLCELRESEEGRDLMLPLTQSVYALGKISSTEKVTVDIGTGYYVEMV